MTFAPQNPVFRDSYFLGAMSSALDTAGLGPSEARVMGALMGADLNALSSGERRTLLSMTRELASDGDIDPSDAETLTTLIDVMQESGADAFSSSWPFPQLELGNFPGNVLFGGLLGAFVGMLVSKAQDAMFSGAAQGLLAQCDGGFCSSLLSEAFSAVDVSTLSMAERAQLLGMLGTASADGRIDSAEARSILQTLNAASDGGVGTQIAKLDAFSNPWSFTQDGGQATIDLGNGYDLLINENRSQLTLINEITGEKTIIWGDPHFDGNGDGRTDMDFWGTLTLNLEDGTKITVNTVTARNNPHMTLSSELTITKGDQAMIVTGMDNLERGDLNISQMSGTDVGLSTDFLTHDGLNIYENPNGEGWLVQDGLGFRDVTQTDMNATRDDKVGDRSGGSFDLLGSVMALSSQMMIGALLLGATAGYASADR